jgi:hypothetical protein
MMSEPGYTPINSADRVRVLEGRLMQMEATLKGIHEEITDLRSIIDKYNARQEEPPQIALSESPLSASPARMPLMAPDAGYLPASVVTSPPARASLEMIMQPDGTLKPERRSGSGYVIIK